MNDWQEGVQPHGPWQASLKTYITLNEPWKVLTASSPTNLIILGEEEVVLEVWNCNWYQSVGLKGCKHVHGLSRNLFSVPTAVAKGAAMSITKSGCALTIIGQKIGVGTKYGSIYHMKTRGESSLWASDELQHRRMDHSRNHPNTICEVCKAATQTRKSFPKKVFYMRL